MKTFDIAGNLPKSKYYLVHACLYGLIQKENKNFEPNKTCIVGPGRKLTLLGMSNKPTRDKKHNNANKQLLDLPKITGHCHLHFGAGRLGLGLVVPLFRKHSNKIIVIQRPSDKWKQIKNTETIMLKINDKSLLTFDVIHDLSKNKGIESVLNKWNSKKNLLVLTNNIKLIYLFMKNSNTISTALGAGLNNIVEYFNNKFVKNKINLYPFENDKSSVELFTGSINKINNMINVIPVVADKICTTREINKQYISVSADAFEEIAILGKNKEVGTFFSGESAVIVTKSAEEQNFYFYKKYYIINGIHMILAIYGYNFLLSKKIPFKSWKNYHLNMLVSQEKLSPKMTLFVKIQSLRIISETDENLLFKILNVKNLNDAFNSLVLYGNNALDRFKNSVDLIIRVYNIDDVESLEGKFKERIVNFINFINNNKESLKTLNINEKPSIEAMLSLAVDLQHNVNSLFLEIIKHKKVQQPH